MALEVTVAVATFGAEWWRQLAVTRPVARCRAMGLPVVHVHGQTLHEARNEALAQVATPWVVHVDGDDELAPGFVEAMATGTADVRAPAVAYINPGGATSTPKVPKVWSHTHDCVAECLPWGNWLVVGSLARTDLLKQVGWQDYPMYEDWDMWLRCWRAGATFEAIPAAVYRAHVRRDSRNRQPNQAVRLQVHRQIAEANGVPVP